MPQPGPTPGLLRMELPLINRNAPEGGFLVTDTPPFPIHAPKELIGKKLAILVGVSKSGRGWGTHPEDSTRDVRVNV